MTPRPAIPHANLIRWLLGLQYLVNGFNWWVKILPFPSLWDDPAKLVHKHRIVGELIATGWMFDMVKAIELTTGCALLLDVFAPLMLVVSMPVLVTAFFPDVLIMNVRHWFDGSMSPSAVAARVLDAIFFGGALLLCQAYAMLAWFDQYRWMLVVRTGNPVPANLPASFWRSWPVRLLAWAAILFGGIATIWLIGMIRQWLIPWASLSVMV